MAVFFPTRNTLLLLPAKCGSSWLRRACTYTSEPAVFLGPRELRAHGGLDFYGRKFDGIAAFIRHPYEWHVSYWNYRTYVHGFWEPDRAPVDRDCGSLPFDDYLNCVYAKYPTRVSDYFSRFIGAPEQRIDFVGKLECINDDFKRLLEAWDINLDNQANEISPINEQKQKQSNPELRDLVFTSERDFYSEFGYIA